MGGALPACAVSGLLAAIIVRLATRRARRDAERQAARWAEEVAERTREEGRQFLHGTVLQTLEALCAPDSHTRIDLLRRQASQDARKLRAFLNDGRCPGMASGFDRMIEELVADANERDLTVEVIEEGAVGVHVLARPVLAALQLAAGEALTNAAKHAGVPSATIRYTATPQGLSLSVADAGSGFDPGSPAHQHGFGLPHSIAAVSRVDGSVTIDATPGGGTLVHFWVPSATGSG